MKKTSVLLLAILSVFSISTYGQNSKFEIGIEGGLSSSGLWGNEDARMWRSNHNYSVGLAAQYNISDRWGIRSGLLLEQKGNDGILDTSSWVLSPSFRTNFRYLTLPLVLRYQFKGRAKYFVSTGFNVGYLLDVKHFFNEEGESFFHEEDITNDFNQFDVSLVTGAGIRIPVKQDYLFSVEVRGNWGIYNVSKLPLAKDGSILHHSIVLLLGVSRLFGPPSKVSQSTPRG